MATDIKENIYVYVCINVISGKTTIMEVVDFYKEANQIFKKASINLRDWMLMVSQ